MKTDWEKIVNDPGSTTTAFKCISSNYELDVLFSDFEEEIFKRVIVIKLDYIPVMIAVSKTHESNELFLDILKNAKTTPIGMRLFAPKSGIKRGPMTVTQIDLKDIDDELVLGYLPAFGMDYGLYYRLSTFTKDLQTMELKEYILPGLKYVINKNKNKILEEIYATDFGYFTTGWALF